LEGPHNFVEAGMEACADLLVEHAQAHRKLTRYLVSEAEPSDIVTKCT
jgi:hypothetical protein